MLKNLKSHVYVSQRGKLLLHETMYSGSQKDFQENCCIYAHFSSLLKKLSKILFSKLVSMKLKFQVKWLWEQ